MSTFWKDTIPTGYYDNVVGNKKYGLASIQANWHKITFENVKKFINPSDKILDYACGSGNFLGSFENLSNCSIGVDISAKQINYANDKYGDSAKFIKLNNFDINSYTGKFNSITCLGLIEFIDKVEVNELIEKFYLCLKPGGRLIITTPNFTFIMKTLETILNKYGEVNYENEYKNRFVNIEIKDLFSDTVFNKIQIKKIITPFVFFSFFGNELGFKINSIFEKIFKNRFGFLFLIVLQK